MIPYYPLSDDMLGRIIRLQLDRVAAAHRGATTACELSYDDDVVKLIAARCTEPESGGRMIDAILTNTVLPQISREFLTRMSQANATSAITLGVSEGDFQYRFA